MIKNKKVVDPKFDFSSNIDVNHLSDSIGKVKLILDNVKLSGNVEAIHTWELVWAQLQHNWRAARVELETHGNYTFL